MQISRRAEAITPFYVMEVAKAAAEMAQNVAPSDRPMVFLNIGEPDFGAAPLVQEAAARAIRQGNTQYSPALGLGALRERIAHWYQRRFGLQVAPERIVVTSGASAALHLACMALIDTGDEVLMPDPSYPCNRHFVSAAHGQPVLIPTSAADRFQLNAAQVEAAWTARTRGVLLASPSNPTGTSIHPDELARIHQVVRQRKGVMLVDEIYLPLSFDEQFGRSALALGDDVISINSFSKYFNMTGWRLGWMVVPPKLVPTIERLAQNLYICPSTIAQHAALACFEAPSLALFEQRRTAFRERRDYFIPALNDIGLTVPVTPDGAFYAWADCSAACARLGVRDSWDFSFELMRQAHIAVTPGRDFGHADSARFVRFSTASSIAQLQTAIERLRTLLH